MDHSITLGAFRCPFQCWRPEQGTVLERFAFDTETTRIDDEHPTIVPKFVLGTVCDGRQGFFLGRDTLLPFLRAHASAVMICHNAAFDLRVAAALVAPAIDLYRVVEEGRVWDTLILRRLLSLAEDGHSARGQAGLADCVRTFLGVELPKDEPADGPGGPLRLGFDRYLGRPPQELPLAFLEYAARDALATWHLFGELNRQVRRVLDASTRTYGFIDPGWLHRCIERFGPLTHHIQLRAAILADALRHTGIGVDRQRSAEKAERIRAMRAECRERMRLRGHLVEGKGSATSLQKLIRGLLRERPGLELPLTASGLYRTTKEALGELAREDSFFADYLAFQAGGKLLSTYLAKMGQSRLHAGFGFLLTTGRTYCSGGLNLQNLPRETHADGPAATIRGCFVPGPGHVFLDADYGQIELVVLGHVLEKQLGLPPTLARLINRGEDVHRHIAAAVLGKAPKDITPKERSSAKAVSFGRPGGMGPARLQDIARAKYGIELDEAAVQQRIDAYHRLCPELDAFLNDEVDPGAVLAQRLGLTPRRYPGERGRRGSGGPREHRPVGWLGGMLLKVLRDPTPETGYGRPYCDAELDFFWSAAQELAPELAAKPQSELIGRRPSRGLWQAVREVAGRRPVFTLTGRLRARATFCSSRNCLFQGVAADGALLGWWRVWRAGFEVVAFVHDQLVVECPADDQVAHRVARLEALMREGMLEVVPGMRVRVETVVTRSLDKSDLHPGLG